jgi:acyl transferase domain-containing protein
MDDAFHYLQYHSFNGNHNTVEHPPGFNHLDQLILEKQIRSPENRKEADTVNPKLMILSSHDATGTFRQAEQLASYFEFKRADDTLNPCYIDDLAYTLNCKRSKLAYNSFAIADSSEDLINLTRRLSTVQKSISKPAVGFIFTGQGAQWAKMGEALLRYPIFSNRMREAEEYLLELGSEWNIRQELFKDKEESNIDSPCFSQPLCTALQVALVDLLESFGVHPNAVIGHSSGEIAAAYCAGAISAKSAWTISYFRGVCAAKLAGSRGKGGSMMALGISKEEAEILIDSVALHHGKSGLAVACINSPRNVTVSGDSDQIQTLETYAKNSKIFSRKLHVDVAYHSPHMESIAQEYLDLIQGIKPGRMGSGSIAMISSVTGARVGLEELIKPEYWVSNMVSQVRFVTAVKTLFSGTTKKSRKKIDLSHRKNIHIDWLLELGPHAALQGPLRDILKELPNGTGIGYSTILTRNVPALSSCLTALGQLRCLGYGVDLDRVNYPHGKGYRNLMTLPDLPNYPFDHSNKYWYESRIMKQYRSQPQNKLDLLGKPVPDWNPSEPKWRNVIRVSEMPWVEDHVVSMNHADIEFEEV